jgi:hypothetical protein
MTRASKVEAIIGLSRGLAHLTPVQCERLLETARRAHQEARRFRPAAGEMEALASLVSAEWPSGQRSDLGGTSAST